MTEPARDELDPDEPGRPGHHQGGDDVRGVVDADQGAGQRTDHGVHHWHGRRLLNLRARTWVLGLTLALGVVIVDICVQGPLTQLDLALQAWDGEESVPWLANLAWPYDKLGQRSVLLPMLLVVAGVLGRKHRTWRPFVLSLVTFVLLNVVVGAIKIMLGRGDTDGGDPSVFVGGVIFPSGHSSNMVLTGALIIYLLRRYTVDPPVRLLAIVVAVTTFVTCVTSVYIGSHWLTDLIGGALVGGLLFEAVVVFDRATARLAGLTPRQLLETPALLLRALESDRDRVDAVAIPGRRLGSVVEDVSEVRPAASAPDLGPPHEERPIL